MGGTGGGDYTVPSGPAVSEQSDADICKSLQFPTNLEPAQGAPVHEPGAVLAVVPTPVGSGTAFVAVDDDGKPVGTIVERVDSLLRCTALGVSYEAVVKEVFLGTHTVQVRATSA